MHITIISGPIEGTLQLINPSIKFALFMLSILALAACAPPKTDDSWDPLRSAEADAGTAGETPAAGDTGMARSTTQLSPAMADLISRADAAIDQQRWPDASALLERALRVNPKQAEAWTRMAVVKLGTGNPEQSIQMARKSNRHARDSRSLMAYNWLLISRAHEQLGQSAQAQTALQKSRQLEAGR